MIEWHSYTFRIKDRAFKGIQPLHMQLMREKEIVRSSGMLWWKKMEERYTGRWCLVLKYNRGPGTFMSRATVYFDRENEARFWFNQTYESVFLRNRPVIQPKKKPKKNKPNLRLL